MSNPYFKFKEFTVYHDKCAMKVGTDGVLLGAWSDLEDVGSILDVGTGTGLISLMLSQRLRGEARIDAIDIDSGAITQAKENVKESGFKDIECIEASLQQYLEICDKKYDLIVSNPPFFSSSLQSPNIQRTLARHADSLPSEELIRISSLLLSKRGRLSVIYPFQEKDLLCSLAEDVGMYPVRVTTVYSTPTSPPRRILIEFSVVKKQILETSLIIEEERHKYSSEFKNLVKDFYLKL